MKFSYKQVYECSNEMANIVSKMNDLVDDIKISCKNLQKGAWSGEAADYYCNKFENVISGFDSISNHITKNINAINKCMENYESIDNLIMNIGKTVKDSIG